MQFTPTKGQQEAISICAEYLEDSTPYSVMLLRGYAGTGKTSLLRAITEAVQEVGMPVELMATTGRAAKLLSQVAGCSASTIHRRIYRASSAMLEEGGSYKLARSGEGARLFIVDEASMIGGDSAEPTPFGSGNLLEDLLAFVFEEEGNRLILVGDSAQLPPVGQEISDALNAERLRGRYGLQVYECELSEVVRQADGSEILRQATYLRELLAEYDHLTEGEEIPLELNLRKGGEVVSLPTEELIDEIDGAYRRYGREDCLIICPSNKRALLYNQGTRARVLDYDERIVRGEQLIVARNNFFFAEKRDKSDFIANGELIQIGRIHRYHSMYDLEFAEATISLSERGEERDVLLLLSGLEDEQAQRSQRQRRTLYDALVEDYHHHPSIVDVRRAIRTDRYWGALEVKYGYAVTAHKAQGGQWACVFIDLGLLGYLPCDKAFVRWLYTSITRATERVYLINVPAQLLPDS